MIKLFLLLVANVYAHCPASFKPENVCLMLDQNNLFIYDHKLEHNGPYKDFTNSKLDTITQNGHSIRFQKAARGVYKLDSVTELHAVDITIENNKLKKTFKIKKENSR
jgi:hypothetical protein